jgi:hypothetical protein
MDGLYAGVRNPRGFILGLMKWMLHSSSSSPSLVSPPFPLKSTTMLLLPSPRSLHRSCLPCSCSSVSLGTFPTIHTSRSAAASLSLRLPLFPPISATRKNSYPRFGCSRPSLVKAIHLQIRQPPSNTSTSSFMTPYVSNFLTEISAKAAT